MKGPFNHQGLKMNCGENTVKYLLFVFNLIFSICGLGLLIAGVFVHITLKELSEDLRNTLSLLTIVVIVLGCIIFVIAFFGCCGAIREHHCMIVTYAIFLLTILVIQVILAICAFVAIRGMDDNGVKQEFQKIFNEYWTNNDDKAIVDTVQTSFHCCGVNGPQDWMNIPHSSQNTYPKSCCTTVEENQSCPAEQVYRNGCGKALIDGLKDGGKLLGGIVLGIAGVELIGIIFALCLANSIKNADRRAFRV